MNEYWLYCEDLNRNVEDQLVAFGPFKTEREAHAFGWALNYADLDEQAYCGFRVAEHAGNRLRVFINPQDRPEHLSPRAGDERLAWPSDEPYNGHDDSGYQCGKDLADDRL
jgi:hypothetical protein